MSSYARDAAASLCLKVYLIILKLISEFGPNYFDDQKCVIGERNVSDDNIASYKDFSGGNIGSYEHLNDAKFHISDDRCVSAVFRWITMVFSSISIIVVLFEEKKIYF